MITGKLSLKDLLQGTRKFLQMRAGRTLFSLNLEVTHRCNLRCDFCPYWRETGREHRLADYSAIIRRLDPLSMSITGGEPLLRSDLEQLVGRIRRNTRFVYINLITNGSLLTVDRALALWRAGINQLTVSLDFPDQRHDALRGRPGLWNRLKTLIPRLAQTEIDNLCLNTVIMKENLAELLNIAQAAAGWGVKVSFSTYNPFKAGNPSHLIGAEQVGALERSIDALMAWKRTHRNITNSDFYLKKVPRYFQSGGIGGCKAGRKWVQVCPDGTLRRCSEGETLIDWRRFKPGRIAPTPCTQCWYACRGEAEAPLGLKRIIELNR